MKLNREQAFEILNTYIKTDRMLNHSIIVEEVMMHFAKLLNEDVEMWGIVGLLHDVDYELYPEQHCLAVRDMLLKHNIDEQCIRAIQSHGYGIVEVEYAPEHIMEKILYTIDELSGLIFSTALMRPNKKIEEVEVSSVIKKFKTPSFSAKVDRQVILNGCEMLGYELEYVTEETLKAMKNISEKIGL